MRLNQRHPHLNIYDNDSKNHYGAGRHALIANSQFFSEIFKTPAP